MQKGLITGIVLALAMVIFTLQNPANVQVKFLFWKTADVPVALFLILSISLGVIIATIFSLMGNNRYKSENKKLKQEVIALEEELDEFHQKKEVQEMISDDGMSIQGDPGNNYFDD
jgi:uncharacterized integral membrane protein